ncbi:hypothetical protein RFI_04236 [Reticulomyxa filosa]|uniref:Uncharacterized protein n=1 Tax=Reticulomyxa filosa TaxID=46433 RepID=X6P451_RETFI|nr:hypothetical protein RFI_04236 [Reticulomyxa filosa]|eukprot:ETO32878.1 hypothetical protein RFI_04236 [Reticulomyxa filosa]
MIDYLLFYITYYTLYIIYHTFVNVEGTAVQEQFDRKYFAATEAVKELHEKLEALATKPDEKQVLLSLMAYRDTLSEKVLQKSLSNRVSRIIDGTLKKLQDVLCPLRDNKHKISEETSAQRDAEKQFHKQALEGTLRQLDQKSERDTFTSEALHQFSTLDKAKLSSESVVFDVNLFQQTYERFLQAAKESYLQEQQAKNTLPWVFRSSSEREAARLSPEQKEREYFKRVREWEQGRNNVDAPSCGYGGSHIFGISFFFLKKETKCKTKKQFHLLLIYTKLIITFKHKLSCVIWDCHSYQNMPLFFAFLS